MALIEAHGLTKKFRQAVKEPGLVGSFKHFFTRQYKDKLAVDHIDLSVEAGESVAYLGPNGALAGAEGKLFVEMSTAGPDLVAEGGAAILVGGSAKDVALATPILGLLGTVRHVGPLGSGARLKLVANSMLADVVLAAAELQVAGEEAGLAPDDVFFVIKRLSPLLEARRHGYLENRHEPSLFALRDLRKDLDLAVDMFGRSGGRTPLTAVSRDLIVAEAGTSPDLDITAVIRPYRADEKSDR